MSLNPESLVRPDMAALVERPFLVARSYPVTASDIRRWAIAVHHPEPAPAQYLSVDETRLVAPLDMNVFAWGAAQAAPGSPYDLPTRGTSAGPPRSIEEYLGGRGPDVRRTLNGGLAVDYTGVRIRPGNVIDTATVIEAYEEKQSRLGHTLFTHMRTTWTDQDGDPVKITHSTLIRY